MGVTPYLDRHGVREAMASLAKWHAERSAREARRKAALASDLACDACGARPARQAAGMGLRCASCWPAAVG